jgi:hypothetical protein
MTALPPKAEPRSPPKDGASRTNMAARSEPEKYKWLLSAFQFLASVVEKFSDVRGSDEFAYRQSVNSNRPLLRFR